MAETNAKDELRNAGAHAKEALRATLLAARGALDIAIRKLDEEPDSGETQQEATMPDAPDASAPEGSVGNPPSA